MPITTRHRVPQVFADRCAGCNRSGSDLCDACRFSLASARSVRLEGGVLAALPYDGVARRSILALKFRNRRSVARHLGRMMVDRLVQAGLAGPGRTGRIDLVTWAPTSARRANARGYDQAELLARVVAAELGVPCRRLLYRSHGLPQAGQTREQRLVGPAFRARRPRAGLRVLVVDDVVTTGASLRAAESELLSAGVTSVVLLAVAAAPDRSVGSLSRHLEHRRLVAETASLPAAG
jgi:ComF family protein